VTTSDGVANQADSILVFRFRVVGQGASRIRIINGDSLSFDLVSDIFGKTISNVNTFDSTVVLTLVGPDSGAPIVGAGFVADSVFARGTGKNITSTIFDSSAVAGYDTISLYADTRGAGGALSGYGFRQILGTTSDTGKTRAYAFAITNSMVGAGETLVFRIRATDTRGNTMLSDTVEITISGGLTARVYGGPASADFTRDSQELVNGLWRDSLGVSRAYITLAETTLPIRIRVIESSGQAETAVAFQLTGLGPVKVGETVLVGGIGQIDATLTLSSETNQIAVVIGDTALVLAAISDTGRIFQESVRPVVLRPDSLINSGGIITDTTRVTLNFGSTGGQVTDTNPNGLKYYRVSDTDPMVSFAFSETATFTIADTAINSTTGIATLYFFFEDDAGNMVASLASDTILVDLVTPLIRTGNGGNIGSLGQRAKGQPITILASIIDSGGVTAATLLARHRNDTGNYISIGMGLFSGTTKDGVWSGVIPDSIVGAIADTTNGVEFFLACTDVVGRTSRYRDSATPESIQIVNGQSGRIFAGPPTVDFNRDSRELTAGSWIDSGLTVTYNAIRETTPTVLIRVLESTGLGDTVSVYIDTSAAGTNFVRVADTVIPTGSGQAFLMFTAQLSQETNWIKVVIFDTAGLIPDYTDQGRVFLDLVAPSIARPDSLIRGITDSVTFSSSGEILTNTRTVQFDFRVSATGGSVIETGPIGVRYFYVSNDGSNGQQYAFRDTVAYTIPDTALNFATNVATLNFRFEDQAGNVSIQIPDTILVDLDSPAILTGNGGNIGSIGLRAKSNSITVSAYIADTGGLSQATLFARHRNDTASYVRIPMALASGTFKFGVWSGTIPETVVGAIADTAIGVEYYLACTDIVGRSGAYKTASVPESIWIVNGLAQRAFVGSQLNFADDSKELSSGQWTDSSATRAYFLLDTQTVDALVRVQESTGLGDTFRISIDTGAGFITSVDSFFANGAGQVSFSGLFFSQETNYIRIESADTAYLIPAVQDTGKIFVDLVRPTVARQDSIINNGGLIADTNGVVLNFGSTGGQASDTGPQGVRAFFVSDTAGLIGAEIGTEYLYTDTRAFAIPASFINPVSGIATLYFHVQDHTGNYSFQAIDTILIDTVAPVISTGNGGNIGSIGIRAKGQAITVTAYVADSGGLSTVTLHARHRNDTSAYSPIAMSIATGDARFGVWTGTIPTSIVGAIADTAIGVEFYIACTDVVGRTGIYKSSASPESIGIVNGVDARVYVRNAQGETTEVTGSTTITSTNSQLTLRVTSSIGDTVRVYKVPAGGAGTTTTLVRDNFSETTFFMAGPFPNGDSVVVVVEDTLVSVPFSETYTYVLDNTKPTITAFTLDPNRAAVDSTGVYVKITFAAAEQNARLFISQSPDTFLGAKNDTTMRFTGTTIDSTLGLAQIQLSAFAGDTATLYASAWDQAGNVADTARVQFVVDRAGPLVTVTDVLNNRPISESVTVTATIRDTTSGLGFVSVQLGVLVAGTTDTYSMTRVNETTYVYTIPGSKIGATPGTVALNVTAKDTFSQSGNGTDNFTISAVSLQIADTSQSFAAGDTVFAQAVLGYVRIHAPGDTVRVTNATSGVASETLATSGGALDTPVFPVPLVAGSNRVTITRTGSGSDSQTYTRWFVSDTTTPTVTAVTLDTGAALTGDTSVVLTFASADSFAVAAYQIMGNIVESSATFIGFNGAASFQRTVTLTNGDGVKSCTVVVRDSAGNLSAGLGATITLQTSLGTVITPTFNASTGDTRGEATRTTIDQQGETVTFLQGNSDTIVCVIQGFGSGDTILLLLDFADTFRQARVLFGVPDTTGLTSGGGDSTGQIGNFLLGQGTIREVIVQDSLGREAGGDSNNFNRLRFTWHLDSNLLALKSSLEVFVFDTISRRWIVARTDSRFCDLAAVDSFLNYTTGDTISILLRHFTIFGVFPAGWPAQASTSNIIVYPNPYVPYDGQLSNGEKGTTVEGIRIGNLPAGASIEIYDVRGRIVDRIANVGNTGLAIWDGMNSDNQEVASGVYLIVVKGTGGNVVKKVAIVR
jgi:hypothetical protein